MTEDRYIVELGTDGSFLLVDRGENRDQRTAFERLVDEDEARLHARTLSSTEELISPRAQAATNDDAWWSEVMAVVESVEVPNYNHLLPWSPEDK